MEKSHIGYYIPYIIYDICGREYFLNTVSVEYSGYNSGLLMKLVLKIAVPWDVSLRTLADSYQHFERLCCHRLQGEMGLLFYLAERGRRIL
jgi:hypothetical protein